MLLSNLLAPTSILSICVNMTSSDIYLVFLLGKIMSDRPESESHEYIRIAFTELVQMALWLLLLSHLLNPAIVPVGAVAMSSVCSRMSACGSTAPRGRYWGVSMRKHCQARYSRFRGCSRWFHKDRIVHVADASTKASRCDSEVFVWRFLHVCLVIRMH